MSQQWLHAWFPVVAMLLQVVFWGIYVPLHTDHHTVALVSFTRDPKDPNW